MRKTLIIFAIIFAIFGSIFTVLPLGTIALFPISIAIFLSFIAVFKSIGKEKTFPKWIFIILISLFMVVIGKEIFIKDEVVIDQQFNQKKETSKQEAQKELEELEGLQ